MGLGRRCHECHRQWLCPSVRLQSFDCRHRHGCGRGNTAPQGVGPAQVERQRLQQADGADFLPAMQTARTTCGSVAGRPVTASRALIRS